ncbi:MAG: hypothetical protein MMC33_005227 [Icmadophila ericetorum]|nr:hypothetical protein [Icmadophila ericetorum]
MGHESYREEFNSETKEESEGLITFKPDTNEKLIVSKRVAALILSLLLLMSIFFGALLHYVYLNQTHSRSWPNKLREIGLQETNRIFEFHEIFTLEPSTESNQAWNNLAPNGKGFVNLDPRQSTEDLPGMDGTLSLQRACISTFHQLHCLNTLRIGYYNALRGPTYNDTSVTHHYSELHIAHCWDYLRQAIMCFSDPALEWLDNGAGKGKTKGWGMQHTCRNYDALVDFAEKHRAFNDTTGFG